MLSEEEFLKQVSDNQDIIHKVCRMYADAPQDRQDLFQEVLLNAWKGSKNYRGEAKFTTWLYRVALNTAITHLRKESRNPVKESLTDQLVSIPEKILQVNEQVAVMYEAINKLSSIDKALVLLYLDEYDHNEIGNMLGITANNVAVKLNRIKARLREETGNLKS